MAAEQPPRVTPISSPWRSILLEALQQTRQRLFMICPFIKEPIVNVMRDVLLSRDAVPGVPLEVRVITCVRPDDLLGGASDIAALQQLLRWPQILPGSRAELRAIDNVHAKVWICDSDLAIVGSGNATPSGLDDNLEYGMLISDPEVVAQILRDWDAWWEKASVVEESSLEELRLWLEQENKALQEIEVQIQEKRKEIERKIGKAPHIGRRIILHPGTGKPLASRMSRPPLPLIMESSEAYGESASSLSSEPLRPIDTEALAPPEAISISASLMQRALFWVFPYTWREEDRYSTLYADFLKIAWQGETTSQFLQFMWADGKRISRAEIPGHASKTQSSWTLTLSMEQAWKLAQTLRDLYTGFSESEFKLFFSAKEFSRHLYIARPDEEAFQWQQHGFSGSPANPSPPLPGLRPPLSLITVEQQLLWEMLERFEEECHPVPITLEMRIDTSVEGSYFTFSTGSLESAITQTVSVAHCTLVGPPITLRLDYAALWQVIISSQRNIASWRLSFGNDATAVQFIPETEDSTLRSWKHQLRHIVE